MSAVFHIHFPFHKKEDNLPTDLSGRRCPLVGGDDERVAGVCRIFAILHRQTLSCDGYHPPGVCPLAHSNDVVVSLQQRSNLIVDPNGN
jgi:hypothetical protein